MKKEAMCIIFLLCVSIVSGQLADSSWPMYHGGPRHGGQSDIDTSHIGGKVKWTFESGGAIETSPVIAEDGTIYFGAHDNKLYAVNPDGTLKWDFYVGKEPVYDDTFDVYKGILSTPAVAKDGTIYFSSLSDIFFALNPDGTEKWRHDLPITSDTWTSPVIAKDGTVYTGSARRKLEGSDESEYFDPPIGGVYAFNPDGTLKWHFRVQADMAGSLALGPDGTIYGFVGGGEEELEGFIRAINPDGTEKWRTREVFTESSPTVAPDGTVYIGLGHEFRGFLALNSDGTEKWFFETSNDISLISGLANDGTVYVGEWDGLFYAFNPDGSIKWSFETPKGHESLISSPAIGADGAIYFGAEDGFHALHPDGTEKWHFVGDIGAVVSSPAIGQDGTVYVGSWNHKLYAFGEGEIAEADKQSTTLFEGSGSVPTCPDGIWDEEEQANPKMCPLDNPNLSEEERKNPEKINHEEVRTNMPYPEEVSEDLHELFDERSFFTRIADWFRGLFGDPEVREMKKKIVLKPDRYEKDFFVQEKPKDVVLESKEVCLMAEEYASGAPILSLPFKLEDYGPKHWGMVPFCADPWNSGNIHGALDFELKPDSKVYAASDGVVEHTAVGQAEGSGEIISVKGEGFFLDYSGLGNIQVKAGDVIKKGDYIANVVQIPHGEYHVHLGIRLDKGPECPIKYMDKEFRDALQQMFAQAHYLRQDEQPCACNCEYLS